MLNFFVFCYRSYTEFRVMLVNWWRKKHTDRLYSIVRWRHNNDVITKKSCMYVQN